MQIQNLEGETITEIRMSRVIKSTDEKKKKKSFFFTYQFHVSILGKKKEIHKSMQEKRVWKYLAH